MKLLLSFMILSLSACAGRKNGQAEPAAPREDGFEQRLNEIEMQVDQMRSQLIEYKFSLRGTL